MGRRAKPAKGKTDAKRSLVSESPKNEGAKIRDLEKRLAEALEREAEASKRETDALGQFQTRDRELAEAREQLKAAHAKVTEFHHQQTATSEILRVISSSPTDVKPVFDTIATSAMRLCEGQFCHLLRFDGELLYSVAHTGQIPEVVEALRRGYPSRPDRGTAAGRAVLSGRIEQIPHVHADREYLAGANAKILGFRSILGVPMLLDGVPIGAIAVSRSRTGFFSERQIELLKTFADQAVIAIENVRLFNETKEALEQQTATSEILRVISQSLTDVQPVFEAIARSAARLCDAVDASINRLDGARLRVVAHHGPIPLSQTELDEAMLLDAG
jgi:two-component system NtrC family sensor kinase